VWTCCALAVGEPELTKSRAERRILMASNVSLEDGVCFVDPTRRVREPCVRARNYLVPVRKAESPCETIENDASGVAILASAE